MFQFVNQSRLKILHLWCSRGRPATRPADLDSRFHSEGERSLRRYQASTAAPSRRSAIQTGLLLTAAAALALAWYASPEKVAGYLADRLPRHFATGSPRQAQLPTPPHSLTPAPRALAASEPAAAVARPESVAAAPPPAGAAA